MTIFLRKTTPAPYYDLHYIKYFHFLFTSEVLFVLQTCYSSEAELLNHGSFFG